MEAARIPFPGSQRHFHLSIRAIVRWCLMGWLAADAVSEARGEWPAPWRFESPFPQGQDLLAAWAAAPGDLYTAGHGGTILHWNGVAWSAMPTPTQKTIFALHGTSPTDLWAVGGDPYTQSPTNRCLVMHYDGRTWTEYPPPTFAGYTYTMNAVWANRPDDVWATQDGGTYVAHFDGKAWELVPPGFTLNLEGSFRAVTGVGNDHVYFAGTHGQIVHRDHGTWRLEQKLESGNFSANILGCLWALDAEHVYVGGSWSQFSRRRADATWEALPVPSGGPFGIGIMRIWGTSATDVYLVAVQSILRFDGTTVRELADFSLGMRRQWFAADGIADRLYGVGPNGVAHEVRLRSPDPGVLSALAAGGSGDLRLRVLGATGCGPEGILVYGNTFALSDSPPILYLEHGVYHPFPTLPAGMSGSVIVKAAWAAGLNDVLVAWQNQENFEAGVARWDGKAWRPWRGTFESARNVVAFWRSPAGRFYAADPLRLLHWNGTDDWVVDATLPESQWGSPISTLIGRSETEIYLGTESGRIHRFDGSALNTETTPPTGARLVALAVQGGETYAAGEKAVLWRRTASGWGQCPDVTPADTEPFVGLVPVGDGFYAAQSTSGAFTGGGLGRLWKVTGSSARLEVRGLSQNLEALATTGSGTVVGLAARDFVISRPNGSTPVVVETALQRLNLDHADWQTIGATKLAVSTPSPAPDAPQPAVAVRHVQHALPFTPVVVGTGGEAAGEYWVWIEDRYFAGSAVPPVRTRVTYDPARLDPAWGQQPLVLSGGETGRSPVATEQSTAEFTLTTQEAVDGRIWSIAVSAAPAIPILRVARSGDGGFLLGWDSAASGFQLETTPELGASAAWVVVTTPPITQGEQLQVAVSGADGRRYFRLRSP